MTNISKKILFFGTEDFSAITLRGLIDAGITPVAVVTKPDTKRGRSQTLTEPAVKLLAKQYNIPVWQPHKLAEIKDTIIQLGDVTGVLVSYGKIIPKSILELFTPGIINLHPSLLPRYRGPSPIESAIINGDRETGVSIMKLSVAMDAGPVYQQTPLALSGHETRSELYTALGKIGTETLLRLLPDIVSGHLLPTPQNDAQASYCSLLTKKDAPLHPENVTSQQAEAKLRAHAGFPGTYYQFGSIDTILTSAHVSDIPGELSITCKDGRFLTIDRLKPLGKKEMPVKAFLAGYKDRI